MLSSSYISWQKIVPSQVMKVHQEILNQENTELYLGSDIYLSIGKPLIWEDESLDTWKPCNIKAMAACKRDSCAWKHDGFHSSL